MALPYYVSPEQMMQDKAEYAKKGIAKGRSIIVLEYSDGSCWPRIIQARRCTRFPKSTTTSRLPGQGSIASSRTCGRPAFVMPTLPAICTAAKMSAPDRCPMPIPRASARLFGKSVKPLEVELLVVQVGTIDHPNEIYRISFDGSITDEKGFAVIGGRSDNVQAYLKERSSTQLPTLKVALSLCHAALEQVTNQKLPSENLEVAVLDRTRNGRKFRRLSVGDARQLIAS